MLPDVIDEIEVDTNERSEAIYYSFFVFFQKFASVRMRAQWIRVIGGAGRGDWPVAVCTIAG